MMRLFCDGCGTEITDCDYVSQRYKPSRYFSTSSSGARIGAEVIVFLNGTSNAGHVCKVCLLKVLNEPDHEGELRT